MELDITTFFNAACPRDYSASVAEIGANAGASTWQAARDDSEDWPILDTDEKREAFREFVEGSGGWTRREIDDWSNTELNALCIQWIAGDMREPVGFDLRADMPDSEWMEYERQCNAGMCSGRIYRGDSGNVYFYIGS